MDIKESRPGYGVYLAVWAGLVILTWLTVSISGNAGAGLAPPFLIASAKAALVGAFFMHLRYEKALYRLFLVAAAATMIVVVWLVFSDIGYRP